MACGPVTVSPPQPPRPLPTYSVDVRVFSEPPDQARIAGAVIEVDDGRRSRTRSRKVRANANGYVRLESVPIGSLTLCASATGYQTQCLDINVVSWGERVSFVLKRSGGDK
jgi:hypothetical protein